MFVLFVLWFKEPTWENIYRDSNVYKKRAPPGDNIRNHMSPEIPGHVSEWLPGMAVTSPNE